MSKNLVSYRSEKNTISVYSIEEILKDNIATDSTMDYNASDFFMIYDTDEIVCLSFEGGIHSSIHGKLLDMMKMNMDMDMDMDRKEGIEDIGSTKGKCTVLSNEGSYWIAIREINRVSIMVSLKRSKQPTNVSICHSIYYKHGGR